MTGFDRHQRVLDKGKRRLLAAMLGRGFSAKPLCRRPYGTMRSAWLAVFPKRRGRAFSEAINSGVQVEIFDDYQRFDLGGEG